MNRSRSLSSRLPLILLLLAVLVAGALLLWRTQGAPPSAARGNLSGAAVGGPFRLVDETGRRVTDASFRGQWRLMYFGFTYCPDVCPMDAAKLGEAMRILEARNPRAAARVQPLFVTVDPERDTPEALAEFTENFHPRLIGLTGSRAEIDAALKAYRIFAARVEGATPGSYTYDHTAIFYLFDAQGRPVQFLAAPTATPEALADMLARFVT
ncbi:MAG: SCO family protein [Sphingomonadaceae bacterium]